MSFDNYLKMTKEALGRMKVKAYCQTCGKPFLEFTAAGYVALSHHLQDGTPDKWFVETGIHWVENDGHQIIFEIIDTNTGEIVHSESISLIWDNKLEDDRSRKPDHSKELQKPYFYRYKEMCKDYPI